MIAHIPHASTLVPNASDLLLSPEELANELLRMTDAYTDELFHCSLAIPVVFPVSRVVVDPECFEDDELESMSKLGMGVIYTSTANGGSLRTKPSDAERERLLNAHYRPHHRTLEKHVDDELAKRGSALVIDCHSFPSQPLPCDQNQASHRPSICIGSDEFHTPAGLVNAIGEVLSQAGVDYRVNDPYAGALVPSKHYQQDQRVAAVMIEINRSLYMDEATGEKLEDFGHIQTLIRDCLQAADSWAEPHSSTSHRKRKNEHKDKKAIRTQMGNPLRSMG